MARWRTLKLDSTESTNTAARSVGSQDCPVVVLTDNQTAGRGQRGNTWESTPGMNLTFSLVVAPVFLHPSRQFELSMLVSVSLVQALRGFLPYPERLLVKWPNDIYYGDRKLAGILIENTVGPASIERSIVGIGLNVNQTVFYSPAPNPCSMAQIAAHAFDRDLVLDKVVTAILENTEAYAATPDVRNLCAGYAEMLWRGDGAYYKWRDTATATVFTAAIDNVAADGRLNLRRPDGSAVTYLFKEVQAELL